MLKVRAKPNLEGFKLNQVLFLAIFWEKWLKWWILAFCLGGLLLYRIPFPLEDSLQLVLKFWTVCLVWCLLRIHLSICFLFFARARQREAMNWPLPMLL